MDKEYVILHKDHEKLKNEFASAEQLANDKLLGKFLQIFLSRFICSFSIPNLFFVITASSSRIKELEKENQQLRADLSHHIKRHSLYKQEIEIQKKNHFIKLADYRNQIHRQICEAFKISPSCFPTLQDKIEEKLPSVVSDSDFEDDFSDNEPEVQEHTEDENAKIVGENKDDENIDNNTEK